MVVIFSNDRRDDAGIGMGGGGCFILHAALQSGFPAAEQVGRYSLLGIMLGHNFYHIPAPRPRLIRHAIRWSVTASSTAPPSLQLGVWTVTVVFVLLFECQYSAGKYAAGYSLAFLRGVGQQGEGKGARWSDGLEHQSLVLWANVSGSNPGEERSVRSHY